MLRTALSRNDARSSKQGLHARILALLVAALMVLPTVSSVALAAPREDGLLVSTSKNRSKATPLDGSTVSSGVWVFTKRTDGVKKVNFFVDDPRRAKKPFSTDAKAPYELSGGKAFTIGDGRHTVTAAITLKGGRRRVLTAAFTVRAPRVTPEPAPQSVPEPTPAPQPEPTPEPIPEPAPEVGSEPAPVGARVGVTYTAEEVAEWRRRSSAGPYLVKSDAGTNSPAEWARIDGEKKAFLAGPGNGRWNPSGDCPGCPAGPGQSGEMEPGGLYLNRLRGAAFWALVRDDAAVGRKVINELLAQVRTPNADMSNRTRFPLTIDTRHDTSPYFMMGNSLSIYFHTMDYTRKWMTAAELTEIRAWLRDGAEWLLPGLKDNYDGLWQNRAAGNYTPVKGAGYQYSRTSSGSAGIGFYGGPPTSNISRKYNNRAGAQETAFALIGIDQNLPNLKAEARRWFKEYIMFSVYPDAGSAGESGKKISWTGGGWFGEFERFETAGDPQRLASETGVSYTGKVLSFATMTADVFARAGDTSLYDYQTTNGAHGTEGAGQPPKSLLYALRTLAKHLNGTIVRYGTEFAEYAGTYNYRMDGYDPINGKETVNDVHSAAIANLYYRNELLKRSYTRGAGFRPYPANPNSDGRGTPYQGPWGLSAGILLQAGNMEQVVNPYGASS